MCLHPQTVILLHMLPIGRLGSSPWTSHKLRIQAWTLARHPALSLFPGYNALSASFPCSLFPRQAPETQGPGKSVKESLCLQNLFWAFHVAADLPVFPGCYLDPSEVSLPAVGEAGLWGSLSKGVLDSLPTPPQFNPSSFPQYKIKSQSVGRKSQNHDCLLRAPVLGKPLVPYPPAMASQGSHPMNTLCPGALCCWRGRGAGSRSAHHPSRATPRRFMLCHCRQRSVLRPYHSFLTLIVLPELKCCI